jgi:hypothetical protein
MTEIATPTPSSSQDMMVTVAAQALLALAAAGCAALAMRWATQGFQGRELWMIGALLAFGLVPAVQLLHPNEGGRWLYRSALALLAVLFFVSGVCPGGSFLMWFAGSLCVYVPVLFWVFEPEAEDVELPAELEAALTVAA